MERNTFLLKDDLSAFEKTLKKHKVKLEYDDFGTIVPILKEIKESLSFDELDLDSKTVFFYSEPDNILFINRTIEDSYQQIDMDEDFFNDLIKISEGDFKLSFLNRDNFKLVFCKYENKDTIG